MLECLKIKKKKKARLCWVLRLLIFNTAPVFQILSSSLQSLSHSWSPHLIFLLLPLYFGEILIKSSFDYYTKASKLAFLPKAPSSSSPPTSQTYQIFLNYHFNCLPCPLQEPLIAISFVLRKNAGLTLHAWTSWRRASCLAGSV